MPSAYEVALGGRLDALDPVLRRYFGEIPEGWVGVGTGAFTVVGTPRRWLWPVLRVLERQGVLFPGWWHDVPFTVRNRAFVDDAGEVAVRGLRTFHFPHGDRVMVDAITASSGGLVDRLGRDGRYRVALDASAVDGA